MLEGILLAALAGSPLPMRLPDPSMRWKLPKALREVSGLARASGGMIWAHDDERGIVYLLDVSAREVRRKLALREGGRIVRADFEGVATLDGAIWLMTSDASLYRAATGTVRMQPTGLTDECEFEGLTARGGLLVLACKRVFAGKADSRLVLWSPDRRLAVGRIDLHRQGGALHVSAVDWCPDPPRFVGVAARERVLFVADELGRIEALYSLDEDLHRQPEGILVGPGEVLIADEGKNHGHLTRYEIALCR